jgi:hypothetical protein
LFDGPDPNASTPLRPATTVPTQALFFMNNPLVHDSAQRLTARLLTLPAGQRTAELCRSCLQREPTATETAAAERLLQASSSRGEQASWAAWCRVLMSSNGMLYVD